MWAGIKYALNSTLGTNDFKSLDMLQKEQLDEQFDLIKSQNEAMEDFIRYKNHELLYNKMAIQAQNNVTYSCFVLPIQYTIFSQTEMDAFQNHTFSKVIFSNNLTSIGDISTWSRTENQIKQIFLPQSDFEITGNFVVNTRMPYLKLPKNIQYIYGGAFQSNYLTVIDCEFSEARAEELGYTPGNAWGHTGIIRFNIK